MRPRIGTFIWGDRVWCVVHRDTCLSSGRGNVEPCPLCRPDGKR